MKRSEPLAFKHCDIQTSSDGQTQINLDVTYNAKHLSLSGEGNGPVDATKSALLNTVSEFTVQAYNEHALDQKGSESTAIAYMQVERDGRCHYGVGIDPNISIASIKAMISALNALDSGESI